MCFHAAAEHLLSLCFRHWPKQAPFKSIALHSPTALHSCMAKKTSSKEKRKTPMKMPMKMPMKTPMKKPASTHLADDIDSLKARLSADIASHLQREKKKGPSPWKALWRWCDDWAVLEPPTLQQLLTSSWKHRKLVVSYEWPVKRHGQSKPVITKFEVNLATMEVKNMMTNTTCPLQLNGPL